MGDLHLRFGQTIPNDAVNLAWVSVPGVTPEHNAILADLASTIPANVADYYYNQFSTAGYTVTLGSSGKTVSDPSARVVGQLSSPIQVLPPASDITGAWHARIRDGIFRQVITVSDSETGWIRTAFPQPGTRIVAIYSVPEFRMVPKTTSG
jgi:hypothetical protein